MNDVEARYDKGDMPELNETGILSANLTNFNEASEVGNMTTFAPTTAIAPNLTVIGTMMKTAIAMTNVTATELENVNHDYYIYIWAILILSCVVFTTGRLVL
ncbi:hypothetical protein O3G_MSEX001059 [Manduca sexta]|nr:hypothetical protein O3G_MSEX001059 [Manduca sexta]KAG6439764.1 hypothetical protein O3G_MSEX001059 [Manduca sexta]